MSFLMEYYMPPYHRIILSGDMGACYISVKGRPCLEFTNWVTDYLLAI